MPDRVNKRLLFVGIPESHARTSIARAQRAGFTVIVADSDRGLRKHAELVARADRRVVVDYESYEELSALTAALDAEARLHAIFTFKERALLSTARVISQRGFLGNSPQTVATCMNKLWTRSRLARAGLPGPAHRFCRSDRELAAFSNCLDAPVVVKPLAAQGSAGVTRLSPGEDAGCAYRLAQAHGGPGVLAEELIDGHEISIEAGVFAGRPVLFGVTEKLKYQGTFIESGHTTPYEGLPRRSAQSLLERVAHALGITFGPIHLEAFLTTSRGPVVGEVHTRYGGDCIVTITEHSTRQDMTSPIFQQLAGRPPTVHAAAPVMHAGIRYLTVPPGRVACVSDVAAARALDGVLGVHVACAPGDVIEPLRSSDDRPGYVLAAAPSREQLEVVLAAALGKLRVTTVPTRLAVR